MSYLICLITRFTASFIERLPKESTGFIPTSLLVAESQCHMTTLARNLKTTSKPIDADELGGNVLWPLGGGMLRPGDEHSCPTRYKGPPGHCSTSHRHPSSTKQSTTKLGHKYIRARKNTRTQHPIPSATGRTQERPRQHTSPAPMAQ